MRMKYNIGDVVRVKEDLVVGRRYCMEDGDGIDSFVSGMAKYAGSNLVVASYNGGKYRLNKANGNPTGWFWTDGMLEDYGFNEMYDVPDLCELL